MENFFNYITKPLPDDEVEIWLKMNNIIPEKMELFSDFSQSLYDLVRDTYLGQTTDSYETKISLSREDNKKHFEWCWNKTVENFRKEGLIFNKKGEHFSYFETFFEDIFYYQKEERIKNSVKDFFSSLFDLKKPFTKSDLDMISVLYKILDKSMKI
jgi:hypothetical protein